AARRRPCEPRRTLAVGARPETQSRVGMSPPPRDRVLGRFCTMRPPCKAWLAGHAPRDGAGGPGSAPARGLQGCERKADSKWRLAVQKRWKIGDLCCR